MDNQKKLNGIFFFDPADKIYGDHFPSNPVVPGSLIVNAFIDAGKKLGRIEAPCAVEGFSFKKFISPGEYGFSIQSQKEGMKCVLYDQDQVASAGFIRYGT